MFRYVVVGVIGLVAGSAWAQQAAPQAGVSAPSSSSAPVQPSRAVVPMEEPQPGDHWTYEVRDEIVGKISATRTFLITGVTPTEIIERVNSSDKAEPNQVVSDRSWNLTASGDWRFSPNDGSGIQLPLAVGKTWNFQCNVINASNGNIRKRSGHSTISGQESVTTKAGTFETYKIEMTFVGRSVQDPSRATEVTTQVWYAPVIDHWVKRTFVSRVDKHVLLNNTIELVDYGRKQ
jgi:hypothetical protein